MSAASLLLAIGATAWLLLVPPYTGVRASAVALPDPQGTAMTPPLVETRHATLVEVNGPGVLVVLAIPNALAIVALAASASNYTSAVSAVAAALILGFCLITAFSIGALYTPSAIAAIAAAFLATMEAPVR